MPQDPFQIPPLRGPRFQPLETRAPPLTEREWQKVQNGFRREFPVPTPPGLLARLLRRLRQLRWTPVLVPVAALALVLVVLLQDSSGNLEFRYPQPSAQTRDPGAPAELSALQRLVENDLALKLNLRRGHVRLTLADGSLLEGHADLSTPRPDALRIVTLPEITLAGRSQGGDVLAGTLEVSLRLTEDAPTNTARIAPAHLRWSKMVLDLTAPARGTHHVTITRQAVP